MFVLSGLNARLSIDRMDVMFDKRLAGAFAFILTVSTLPACGAVDQKAPGSVHSEPTMSTIQSVRAAAAASPTAATTDAGDLPGTDIVPLGMAPITFPPVEVNRDEMIAIALRYTVQREAVLSGIPEVIGTTRTTAPHLNAMGLSLGNVSPACLRPMYLVVLKGDFDGRSLVVGLASRDEPYRVSYIGYVFDQAHGAPGSITATFLSPDGSGFRQILNDPSLPEPMETFTMDPKPPYMSCVDVTITGEQEGTPVATPVP
jgi:hypothetical protein